VVVVALHESRNSDWQNLFQGILQQRYRLARTASSRSQICHQSEVITLVKHERIHTAWLFDCSVKRCKADFEENEVTKKNWWRLSLAPSELCYLLQRQRPFISKHSGTVFLVSIRHEHVQLSHITVVTVVQGLRLGLNCKEQMNAFYSGVDFISTQFTLAHSTILLGSFSFLSSSPRRT
jgi:hypothetical protein